MSVKATFLMPHAPILISDIGNNQTENVLKTVRAIERVAEEINQMNPDTIIVISPHGPIFNDAIAIYQLNEYIGNFEKFGVKDIEISFEKDERFIEGLLKENNRHEGFYYPLLENEFLMFQQNPTLDHGILVPLYFLRKVGLRCKIVCMSFGSFSYETLMEHGLLIHKTSKVLNQNTIIIASGDLSHTLSDCGPCEYHSSGEKVDALFCESFSNQNIYGPFLADESYIRESQVCGMNPFALGIGAFIGRGYESTLHSYEAPFGVGYMVASLKENTERFHNHFENFKLLKKNQSERNRLEEHFYPKVARLCIEHYQKTGRLPRATTSAQCLQIEDKLLQFPYDVYTDDLMESKGVFVTLMHRGNLKGCMGCFEPMGRTLLDLLIDYSINAFAFDPRFESTHELQVDEIEIHVEILSPLEKVFDKGSLDSARFGIVVEGKDKRGVLLPNIKGIYSVEEQLKIACNKTGITVDEIEQIYRFSTIIYK